MMYTILVVAVFLISCTCAQLQDANDQVKMTLLSVNHYESEVDGEYQCHLSDPDTTGTTVTSFRKVYTRNNGKSENPDPPDPVSQGGNFPHYKVSLDDNGNDEWFGVLRCRAPRNGRMETEISTTRMRSDAHYVPTNKLFTQTANVGDTDVGITMESLTGESIGNIRWRKDNSDLQQNGMATFRIDGPVQLSDAGVYECQRASQRDQAKQGLNVLLVRACSANRWSPPDCNGVCDSCYDGGICDENNGKCVCAPAFTGNNCLTACGGNIYGYDCEIKCLRAGGDDSCEGLLFCLIHPYGCRCNTGWKGLACKTACDAGIFGASCLQSCSHCTSGQCDRYTGRCAGSDTSCKLGWTGDSCQECDGNYFGTNCIQECHCSKESCNRETGLCKPGGCLPQWVDRLPPYSCQTGLINLTYLKMNRGIPVTFTCEAEEGPGDDLASLELVLSKDSESLVNGNITDEERSVDGTTRNFTVTNVRGGDILHCQLRSGGIRLAVLSLLVEVFALPELTSAPVGDSVYVTLVTIRWLAWDETTDVGDPPLVGYIPYHKKTDDGSWIPSSMVSPQILIYSFNSLDPDTSYSFSVAAVREGEGGEGPKSPELFVRTLCTGPENVTSEISGERQELVKVSWQLPSEGITCSSGVTKFTIYYSSLETTPNSEDVFDPLASSVILYGLTPGVSYTLYVTLSTSGGESDKRNDIDHLLPVLPTLTDPPSLTNATCNSVTMVWERWTEGKDAGTPPVNHYMPYYRVSTSSIWTPGYIVPHSADEETYQFIFYNLANDSPYDFCVVTVREGYGGEGDRNNIVSGKTEACKEGINGYVIAISVMVPTTIISIILTVVFIYLRCWNKSPVQTPPKEQVEAKYDNKAFTATADYNTIDKDYETTQSNAYQGLNTKHSSNMVVEEHAKKTDDTGYELSPPSLRRSNVQFSDVINKNNDDIEGIEESHYEDPDVLSDKNNAYANLK